MAISRARGIGFRGFSRALWRLILLVGFGFAVGLVVGVVSEEPTILYGHLKGDGESVPLIHPRNGVEALRDGALASGAEDDRLDVTRVDERILASSSVPSQARRTESGDDSESGTLPSVAAPAPSDSVAGAARPDRVANSDRAIESGDEGQWAIQVGAFSDEAAARRLVEILESKSYPVRIVASNGSSRRWRVRVQPVKGQQNARGMASRLKRDERLPTWLIPLEAGRR